MKVQDKVKLRHEYNNRILSALKMYLNKNKDLRLIQALQNLGIINADGTDRFYEESYDTYQQMLEKMLEEVLWC